MEHTIHVNLPHLRITETIFDSKEVIELAVHPLAEKGIICVLSLDEFKKMVQDSVSYLLKKE